MNLPPLQPGDLLIFSRKGLFDFIIKVKTFSAATHTEIYLGNGKTVAARNGKGCDIYSEDLAGLHAVLRPALPFDLDAAMKEYYSKWSGKPYGWLSLFSFVLINLHDRGLFCSELSTLLYRAGGFEPFEPEIPADRVAPGSYLYVNESVMKLVWKV